MRISVIVPAFNEERLLEATLTEVKRALRTFEARQWETELIVCDNNSKDRTAEIAAACGAKVVFEPINQIARARNTGAQAATGDWLVFVDADTHPSPELFADVADAIASGRCLAGGSTVRLEGNHRLGNGITEFWNWISRLRRWMAGSFIFCDAAVFREVGGFSQELFAAEEIDLSQRLKKVERKHGRKIVILNKHRIVTSARKLHLYTAREHFRLIRKAILRPRQSLRDREACHTWYDGRR